jgi:hypothetical protein
MSMRRLLPIVLVLAATALPSAQMAPAVYTGKDIA